MRRRPWPLVILAILHIVSPFFNILVSGLFLGFSPQHSVASAFNFEVMSHNFLIMFLPVIAGLAIYACQKWSFYVYLLSMMGMFVVMFKDANEASDMILVGQIIIIFGINILITIYFFLPEVRKIYFDKKMRWWENKPRYHFNQPCQFKKVSDEKTYAGEILDISESGLFLKSSDLKNTSENVEITFSFTDHDFSFTGRTIPHDRTDVIGFGVEFQHDSISRRIAKEIVSRLKDQGAETRTKVLYEDTFGYWLKSLKDFK